MVFIETTFASLDNLKILPQSFDFLIYKIPSDRKKNTRGNQMILDGDG